MQQNKIVFDLIEQEAKRQAEGIELIASENFTSVAVMQAQGSCLTNKYAEGLPKSRYYGGCQVVDEIEQLAIDRAKTLFSLPKNNEKDSPTFDCTWANVQPHSGVQANAAVLLAFLKPYDKVLGLDLNHGGHLTHGSKVNASGKMYSTFFYGVNKETGLVDYKKMAEIADIVRPKLIICGASSYSRDWDYAGIRKIADSVKAYLWADIAHPAGLIVGGLLNNPLPHCHVVTTTTHKTLRGPRGGLILMGQDFENPFGLKKSKLVRGGIKMMSEVLDGAVFPGTQGGPLEHVIAAKAVAFGEALAPDYKDYVKQVQQNAKVLADNFLKKGYQILSGGTDNHMMLINLTNKNITGKAAEDALVKADITLNKNMIPFDTETPSVTSGIRIGTAAITTRGMQTTDMPRLANLIDEVLMAKDTEKTIQKVKKEVNEWMKTFPIYPAASK